jgi:hypothetical protein
VNLKSAITDMLRAWHRDHHFFATVTGTDGVKVFIQRDGEDAHPQSWPVSQGYLDETPATDDRVYVVDVGTSFKVAYFVVGKVGS